MELLTLGKEAVIAAIASLLEAMGVWLIVLLIPAMSRGIALRAMIIPLVIVALIYKVVCILRVGVRLKLGCFFSFPGCRRLFDSIIDFRTFSVGNYGRGGVRDHFGHHWCFFEKFMRLTTRHTSQAKPTTP